MRDFDKYARYGDYHWKYFLNPCTYRDHAIFVKNWVTHKDVLDIGCGDGLITYLLGAEGIDDCENAVRMARRHGVKAKVGSVYDLSKKRRYEAVFMGDVLEHLDYPDKALNEIAKITNILYLVTPKFLGELRPYHVNEWTEEGLHKYLTDLGWIKEHLETRGDRIYGLYIYNPQEG